MALNNVVVGSTGKPLPRSRVLNPQLELQKKLDCFKHSSIDPTLFESSPFLFFRRKRYKKIFNGQRLVSRMAAQEGKMGTSDVISGIMVFEPILEEGVFRFDCSGNDRDAAHPSLSFRDRKVRETPILTRKVPEYRPSFECVHGQQTVFIELPTRSSLYGTGEVSGQLERTGKRVFTWNTDAWGYGSGTTSLYQSHPWVFVLLPNGEALGVLADTTCRCEIDLRNESTIKITAPAAYPIITFGPFSSPTAVLISLSHAIGTIFMPPKWSLGYHQCRWSYDSDVKVLKVAKTFREKGIPCDVIWMDIDYMDGFRCFTFDQERFSDPKSLANDLHVNGFNAIWMLDPGIKQEAGYFVYDSGSESDVWIQHAFGQSFVGEVWPGRCVFPDFTQEKARLWWAKLVKDFVSNGVDGIWNDMNEPAVFKTVTKTMPESNIHKGDDELGGRQNHSHYHNVYGMLMARSTFEGMRLANEERRPFVLTRAGFIGSQRYAATWTGDNLSTWEHLHMSISMVLSLGLSGQPLSGPDIGGFAGNATPRLFGRWMGVGAMFPFCRGHSETGTIDHEPWSFGEECEEVCRLALLRRYRFIPHIYTLFYMAHTKGIPVATPIFFADPKDPYLRKVEDSFLLGPLLVCASTAPDKGSHVLQHVLPKGIWLRFDYFPRLLSKQIQVPLEHGFTLGRFLPSISWIKRAFQVSEEEILQNCGFDALVVLRLFKFGINFFWVCSVIGLVILLPVNYTSNLGSSSTTLSHSMDSFTISNITRGSNRLWVHLSCLYFITFYVLYLLYKEYDGILRRRIQYLYNFRHRPEQFTVLVREIPFCSEFKDHGCCVDHFFSKHHPYTYQSCQIVYDGGDIVELLRKAESIVTEIENLRQRTLIRKQTRGRIFFDCFGERFDHIRMHELKLQELCQKIRYLQGETMLKQKELPVAFVSFKSRWGATLAARTQQYVNPLLWITELAPEPRDVLWHNLAIPYRYLAFHKIGVYVAASLLTIFFAIPVTAVQGIAQLENIKKWFPPARAVQLIPGLNSVLTGYLPSVILNNFIYIIPFAMLYLSSLEGCVSRSKKEMKACSMVFYFLVGNVFFLSLLSGSLLDQIGQSVTRPRSFPSHLASAVSAQADFFITYILTDGLSGFSLEVLQPGLIIWRFMSAHSVGRGAKAQPYLYSVPYYRFIPIVSLSILIGMVYAVIAPLLLPFLIVYFFLGYVVYLNQIQDVYATVYETCGQYWPYIHHYILVAIILMQITMIGLFGMKSKPAASISTIPLLLLTILFNEYCKSRFLPSFYQYSVQSTMEMDERDAKEGLMEANRENAIYAYRQPSLRPMNIDSPETSTIQPLVSSS